MEPWPEKRIGAARWAALALALIVGGAAPAHADQALTLDEAVRRAVDRNASLRAAEAGADISDAQHMLARSRLMPRVDVSESYARTDHPVLAFGARLAQKRLTPANLSPAALNSPNPIDDWISRLEAHVPLVDAASWYGLSASASGQDAAQAARRGAEAQVVAETIAAYYAVQLAHAELEVAREMLESSSADLKTLQAGQGVGTVMAADVAGLSTEVASHRGQLIRAEGRLAIAQAALARVLGDAPDASYELATPLTPRPSGEGAPGASLSPEHPMLAQTQAALEAASAKQSAARADYAPTLGFMAALEHHAPNFAGAGGKNYLVGLELRFNVFAGGSSFAKTKLAKAELAKARAMAEDARSELELGLIRAQRELADAGAIVEVTAEAVEHARESHRLERARFESGMAQANDVMRTRTSLLLSEQRHLSAVYGQRMAAVQLAAASGTLDRNFQGTKP